MNINFDKSRYIELLKKEETLKNQEISFLDENPKESCELLSYKIILENQIYYNRKTEYIFLVEEYLRENAGEDGARLFLWEFFIIFKKDNKVFIPEFGAIAPRRIAGGQDPHSKAAQAVDPEFAGQSVDPTHITLFHLLTHTSCPSGEACY